MPKSVVPEESRQPEEEPLGQSPNWASEQQKALKDRGYERINDPRKQSPAADRPASRAFLLEANEAMRRELMPSSTEGILAGLDDLTLRTKLDEALGNVDFYSRMAETVRAELLGRGKCARCDEPAKEGLRYCGWHCVGGD